MKEFRNLFVLAGSGSNVLAWRSRPVTDESRLSGSKQFKQDLILPSLYLFLYNIY